MPIDPSLSLQRLPTSERRKRTRERVRWPILLLNGEHNSVRCVTQNLSSDGVFFLAEIPLHPGELLICTLKVPRYACSNPDEMTLLCEARILRAEPIAGTNSFGIACRLEDYHCSAAGERRARAAAG